MKKISLSALFLLAVLFSHAQEEGKFRVGLNLGAAIPSGGVGFMIDLEPKYNLNERMNVGIRLGSAAVIKSVELTDGDDFESASVSATATYFGTFDYYFPTSSSFTPYVGGGLGLIRNAAVSVNDGDDVDSSALDASTGFGGVVRGGFEAGKFRFTLEYDLIPETTLENANGDEVGTIKNGFFGVAVGFFVGGGRW